ncbi:MAG: A24 family peptidase C-terminal domain-containing protein [archaeon]|nr:A24 family peptidase C-terminal domain-containing protein [archaeon]
MPLSLLFFSPLITLNTFFFLFFFLSIALLAIGTYTDFKYRIISNKLTYSMIFLGIALHLLQSYFLQDYSIILITAITTIATFIGAYILWKLGAWAGGDVKAFTALAALNPVNYAFLANFFGIQNELLATIAIPIFPLTLFIFSIFAMLPYGAMLGINGLKANSELRKQTFSDFKQKAISSIKFSGAIVGINQILLLFSITSLLVLPIILILGIIKGRIQTILFIGLFIVGLYFGQINAIIQFIVLLIFFILIYAILKLFSLSRSEILKKEAKIEELEEGMIPAYGLNEINGEIKKFEGISMGKLFNHVRNNSLASMQEELKPKGREIISNRRAAGISLEEIEELKQLRKAGKIGESITVKLSAPMIPAVFIAFIILSLIGDLIWNILF